MIVSVILVLAWIATVSAIRPHPSLGPSHPLPPLEAGDEFAIEAAGAVSFAGNASFTQLLDHDNPSKGTFQQKFWWNYQFWEGPGSPVSLVETCNEVNTDRIRLFSSRLVKRLLNTTLPI